MEKKIAIVTGASGGIGKAFVTQLLREEIDEVWAIARNPEKLAALREELGDRIVPVSKDLTKSEEWRAIGKMLEEQNPTIAYLINNAGVARMGAYKDFTVDEATAAISINCSAPVALCTLCIPYMQKGSHILNISSAASFQPLPYLNLYAATKAFERSYSRALNVELKETGITATAVCPSWVDTDLLMKEVDGKRIKFPGLISPEQVVRTALKDAKRGKDMSVCSLHTKCLHGLTKLSPHKAVMHTWVRRIAKYATGWGE